MTRDIFRIVQKTEMENPDMKEWGVLNTEYNGFVFCNDSYEACEIYINSFIYDV
jgi:hypothetical protein